MKGRKIINEFFKLVHQEYALSIPHFNEDVDAGLYTFDAIIIEFKAKPLFTALKNIPDLIDNFQEGCFNPDFLDNHYVKFNKSEVIKFSDKDFIKRNRSFNYIDNEFGFFSMKKILEDESLNTLYLNDNIGLSVIHQFISSCIVSKSTEGITQMLSLIKDGNKEAGLLLQKVNQRCKSAFIYSFVYFRYLCQGNIVKIDEKLKYTDTQPFIPTFTKGNKYSQFFEIFDVANEINHSKDIVSRFLKVYHILEYLSYRVRLVKIEQKARERVTFIREVSSLHNANEEDFLKKCFANVFELDIATIRGKLNLTPQLKEFIETKFDIPQTEMHLPNFIPKLIYRIRNSIVHNKESEFHITISNPKEYSKMVNMMHRIITILEEVIYKRINEPKSTINYGSPVIELY